ncbi:uncharacterized protein LOC132554639 [Ylistrum balloti]|uniref:uncharacterized protein LOC132554639 n=1 Tax=Ylistrum balloti TaxID=509963 RepID=UPI002905E6DF|nr:uncharacterized protein LOC132554639 [Ylistrum balloti]
MADSLLVLFVYGALLQPVLGVDSVPLRGIGTYHNHAAVWKDARKLCRNRGGKLLTIEDIDNWDKVVDQLNVTNTGPFIWVGGREIKDAWIWSHDLSVLQTAPLGCFTEKFTYSNTFINNQPTLCTSFCRHSMTMQYAALKGSECFCLREETSFKSVLEANCNTACPGNRHQVCGGDSSVTVYNTEGSLGWHMHKPDAEQTRQDCGQIMRITNNETMWYSGNCTQRHKYVCKIVNNPAICTFYKRAIPCYYASEDAQTWFEAGKKCKQMGGHLADRAVENEDEDSLLNYHSFYWTGLTRLIQTWIGGNKDLVDFDLPRSLRIENKTKTCLALQRSEEDDSWSLGSVSCKEELPYVCQTSGTIPESNEYTYRNDQDMELPRAEIEPDDHWFVIFYIVIPSAAGTFMVIILIIIICSVRRRNAKKAQRKKEEEHFYFVLEKEESIYNTIDGPDTMRETPFRVKPGTKDQPRSSKITPKPDNIVTDNTYHQLEFKGRMSNAFSNGVLVHHVDDSTDDNPYDVVRSSEYDTIENIKRSCFTLVDKPYDKCGSFTRPAQDINCNQNNSRNPK